MLRPALGGLRRKMDPDMTGGAILLGVRGVAVVGHGSSGPGGNRERDSAGRARGLRGLDRADGRAPGSRRVQPAVSLK